MRLPIGIEDLVRNIRDELPSGSALDHLHTAVELADQANALGDGLVGHFVEAARGEGCSWAQIGAQLGVSKQAAQQRFVARPIDALMARLRPIRLVGPPLSRMGFFSRFTTAACDTITFAQEQARQLGHDAVRPAHLLLSLLRDLDGRPTVALCSLGIDVEAARRGIIGALGGAQSDADDSPPFAPEAKKVLERALREGLRSPMKEVAPEHILLGTLAEGDAVGIQIFIDLGATPDAVRTALDELA